MSVPFLPYGRQTIDDEDVAAVTDALRGALITQGPLVEAFEAGLARYTGSPQVSVCANGTAALHLAYLALGLGPGDEIVTSPVTFAATANAARYCGADVRFADVEPDTGLVDPKSVESLVGPKTRGIVAVHLGGLPCDLAALRAIADRHRLWLVEDAAHALGATYRGESIGNGRWCEAATLSFHPVKHLTTGEGGAVCVRDPAAKRSIDQLRHHGVDREPKSSPGPWYHEIPRLGFNYRLTDLQCALGISQLKKQPAWLARRRAIAKRYTAAIAADPALARRVRPQGTRADRESAWHLYPVLVDFGTAGRAKTMDALKARGIGTQVHYIPVERQPLYRGLYGDPPAHPGVAAWYDAELSLPMYPALTDADVDRVVEALAAVLR